MKTSKSLQQVLHEAEVLLQSKRFSQALELLRSIDPPQYEDELRPSYCVLLTEAGLFSGDYSDDVIDDAIEAYRFDKRSELFAKTKYLKGRRLASLGRHFEAKEHLLEAYAGYLRCNDLISAARPLNFLAYVQLQCGEVVAAISSLERSLQIVQQAGQTGLAAIHSMNLALVLRQVGNLVSAGSLYARVETEVIGQGPNNAAVYYIEWAMVSAQQGSLKGARETLARSKPYLEGLSRETAIYYEKLGWIALIEGKHAQCRKALKAGLEISLRIAPESALVSQIKRLMADCSLATTDYSRAQHEAADALAVAEKIGQRMEIAACWRVFAQVEAHDGHSHTASDWYRKAIEIFSQISARYELAATRYLFAVSGLLPTSESTALLYLAKEYFEAEQVAPYIEKVNAALRRTAPAKLSLPGPRASANNEIITNDKRMKELIEIADHVAPTGMTVLLTGETGTGKDLFARYIHERSGRTGRFVSQNFAALPLPLAESELFGHKRGAFTNSAEDKPGLFEAGTGGTFYINEIADAPLELQSKLLEVIETRTIRRLGEVIDRTLDIRIIAATNHDLATAVRENRFRADLYHRLNEINLHLPPLAERTEDIPMLVRYFLKRIGIQGGLPEQSRLIDRIGRILASRLWPGNIRQLGTQIKTLAHMADRDLERMAELALTLPRPPVADEGADNATELVRALDAAEWNRSRAADALGISEGAVRKRIRKFGIVRD